jgi:hypothetical protein
MTPLELQRLARHSARMRAEVQTWLCVPARASGDAEAYRLARVAWVALLNLERHVSGKLAEAEGERE